MSHEDDKFLEAQRETLAQALGKAAAEDVNPLPPRLRHLQLLTYIPGNSFMERRQAQLDSEDGTQGAA